MKVRLQIQTVPATASQVALTIAAENYLLLVVQSGDCTKCKLQGGKQPLRRSETSSTLLANPNPLPLETVINCHSLAGASLLRDIQTYAILQFCVKHLILSITPALHAS